MPNHPDDLTRAPIYIPRGYKSGLQKFIWTMFLLFGLATIIGLVAAGQVYFCKKDSWKDCLIEQ